MPNFITPLPLSTTPPVAESTTPIAGVAPMAARTDHVHPRLSATGSGTLSNDAAASATLTFSRSFTAQPSPVITLIEATAGAPVVFKVQSWIKDGNGNFTGAVISGQRLRALPDLSIIVLLTNLASTLNLYQSWTPASNAAFSYLMLASSVPPP